MAQMHARSVAGKRFDKWVMIQGVMLAYRMTGLDERLPSFPEGQVGAANDCLVLQDLHGGGCALTSSS